MTGLGETVCFGRATWRTVVILVFTAAVIRVIGLEARSLWGDEITSLAYATGHSYFPWYEDTQVIRDAEQHRRFISLEPMYFSQRLVSVLRTETQAPLYYALLNLWLHLWGTSEIALRSLSTLFSIACVPVLYALGRRLASQKVGLLAAAIFVLSPFQVAYAQYARPYALLAFLALLSSFLAVLLADGEDDRRVLWSYGAVATFGLYTHYLFVWTLLFHVVLVIFRRRRARGFLLQWTLVLAAMGIVFAVWLPVLRAQVHWNREAPSLSWFYWLAGTHSSVDLVLHAGWLVAMMLSPGRIRRLCLTFGQAGQCTLESALTFTLYSVAILLVAFSGWRLAIYLWDRQRRTGRFSTAWATCVLWGACVFGGPLMIDLVQGSHMVFELRYFIAGGGPVYLAVALGLGSIVRPPLRAAAIAGLILYSLFGTVLYLSGFSGNLLSPQGMRDVARHLDHSTMANDVVLMLNPGPEPKDLAYYLRSNPDLGRVNILGRWRSAREIPVELEQRTAGRTRVWYLDAGGPESRANDETLAWLEAHYAKVETRTFKGLQLYLFASPVTVPAS